MNAQKTFMLTVAALFTLSTLHAQVKLLQPCYYRAQFGPYRIIALSDGTVPIDATKLLVAKNSASLVAELARKGIANPVEISINVYLIIDSSKIILVDTGSGELFGSNGGELQKSLRSAGYRAEDITDILITHIHADHTGGLTIQSNMMFPNALIHVNQKELDFWKAHEKIQLSDTRGLTANRPAFLAIKPYLVAGRVKAFAGDIEVLPGIKSIEATGHTAGHTLYSLKGNRRTLIFVGDLVHIEQIQLHDAAMPDEFDFDKDQGAQQRQKSYAMFAQDGDVIAADHISFPGIGHIVNDSSAYKWVPVPYSVLGRME